jgi:hypothetical protein
MQQREKKQSTEPLTFVSVHVRRTDYEHHMQFMFEKGGYYYSSAYFKQAMDYFRVNHTNVVFVVASDDNAWCEENLSDEDVFFTRRSSRYASINQVNFDFAALVSCNNSIVSSGTFGIWSAFLKSTGTHIYNGYEHKKHIAWPGLNQYLNTPTTTWIQMEDPCRYILFERWAFRNSTTCIRF